MGQDVTGVMDRYRPASHLQKDTSCICISGFGLRHPEIKCSRNKGIQHTKSTKEITGRRKYSNDLKKKNRKALLSYYQRHQRHLTGQEAQENMTWWKPSAAAISVTSTKVQTQGMKNRKCELKMMMIHGSALSVCPYQSLQKAFICTREQHAWLLHASLGSCSDWVMNGK